MLVLESASSLCLLRPEPGLLVKLRELPRDTARFAELLVLRRPKRDDLNLPSLEPEVRNVGDEALESEACLRIALGFGRVET